MKNIYLENLLKVIAEKKSIWGTPEFWTHRNYKILSEEIFEASGFLVSEQTIKRLYGKVKTNKNYTPHIDTLDALAKYYGFKDWVTFIDHSDPTAISKQVKVEEGINKGKKIRSNKISHFLIGFIFLLAAVFAILILNRREQNEYDYSFEGLITEGFVPYTVTFKYDFSNVDEKVFFKAGGESKEELDKTKTSFSNTFLTPNFYVGELFIGDSVVQTINLHNKSKRWVIGYNFKYKSNGRWEPYKPFFDHIAIKNTEGTLFYPFDSLLVYEKDINPDTLWTDIRYINKFNISLDSCIYETRFKSVSKFNFTIAAEYSIILFGEKGNIHLHFVEDGFESKVYLKISNITLDGHYDNLSRFALDDIYSWNNLRVESNGNEVLVYVNEYLIKSINYKKEMGEVKGVRMSFRGTGKIDYFRVKDLNDSLVYAEEF
jgi:hypothetical protein